MSLILKPIIGEISQNEVVFLQIINCQDRSWVPDTTKVDVNYSTKSTLSTDKYNILRTVVKLKKDFYCETHLKLYWTNTFQNKLTKIDEIKHNDLDYHITNIPLSNLSPKISVVNGNNIWVSETDNGVYKKLANSALNKDIDIVLHLGDNVNLNPYIKKFIVDNNINEEKLTNSFIECYIKTWNLQHVNILLCNTTGLFFTSENDYIPKWILETNENDINSRNRIRELVQIIEDLTHGISDSLWLNDSYKFVDFDRSVKLRTISPCNSPTTKTESPRFGTKKCMESPKNTSPEFCRKKSIGRNKSGSGSGGGMFDFLDKNSSDVVGLLEEKIDMDDLTINRRFRSFYPHTIDFGDYILCVIPTWYCDSGNHIPKYHNPIEIIKKVLKTCSRVRKNLLLILNGKSVNYSGGIIDNYIPLYLALLSGTKNYLNICFVSNKTHSAISGKLINKKDKNNRDNNVLFFTTGLGNDTPLSIFSNMRKMSGDFKLVKYNGYDTSKKIKSSLIIHNNVDENFTVIRANSK